MHIEHSSSMDLYGHDIINYGTINSGHHWIMLMQF